MPFEHSNKRVIAEIAVMVGAVAVVVLAGWALLRGLMELAARHVPPQVERPMGDALAAVVKGSARTCQAPEVTSGVEGLARALAREAGLDAANLEVKVLDDSTVNAFALPGGHVFVFTGLLQKAETPDEVAGVLAHELGHVVLRHHLRSAIRQMGVGAALSVLLGDADTITAVLVGGSSQLLDLAFSRDQEEAADAFAVELAARTGFQPAAMGRLLERLEEPGAPPSLLRTHPSGPDRRRRLEALAAAHPVRPGGPAVRVSMETLRGSCAR